MDWSSISKKAHISLQFHSFIFFFCSNVSNFVQIAYDTFEFWTLVEDYYFIFFLYFQNHTSNSLLQPTPIQIRINQNPTNQKSSKPIHKPILQHRTYPPMHLRWRSLFAVFDFFCIENT